MERGKEGYELTLAKERGVGVRRKEEGYRGIGRRKGKVQERRR